MVDNAERVSILFHNITVGTIIMYTHIIEKCSKLIKISLLLLFIGKQFY